MLYVSNSELNKLLQDFFLVTGIRVAVNEWSNDESVHCIAINYTGDFCDCMQSNIAFHNACRKCDKMALMRCRKEKKGFLYRCHAGFWEYITPIYSDNVIVAYICTGMATDGSIEEYETLKKSLMGYGLTEIEFEQAYHSFPHRSPEQIEATCNILEACISHMCSRNMVRIRYTEQIQRIDRYIADNLQKNLSISHLCKQFELSRSELYHIFREFYQTGVSEFIRDKRLAVACLQMQTTDKSITEIAADVGYADYNYFSKVFRKIIGISPRNYRKELEAKVFEAE